jgi:hypothetical protein
MEMTIPIWTISGVICLFLGVVLGFALGVLAFVWILGEHGFTPDDISGILERPRK